MEFKILAALFVFVLGVGNIYLFSLTQKDCPKRSIFGLRKLIEFKISLCSKAEFIGTDL